MRRGERAFHEDSLVAALSPLGPYLPSVVLCGSWTIFIYRHWLYKCAGPMTVVTRDVDIAVPRDLPIEGPAGMTATLVSAGCRKLQDLSQVRNRPSARQGRVVANDSAGIGLGGLISSVNGMPLISPEVASKMSTPSGRSVFCDLHEFQETSAAAHRRLRAWP